MTTALSLEQSEEEAVTDPEKLQEQDATTGWTPLHYAVAAARRQLEQSIVNSQGQQSVSRASAGDHERIRLLVQNYPDAVKTSDFHNRLPLHIAILCGKGIELYKLLLQHYPQAIHQHGEISDCGLHSSSFRTITRSATWL